MMVDWKDMGDEVTVVGRGRFVRDVWVRQDDCLAEEPGVEERELIMVRFSSRPRVGKTFEYASARWWLTRYTEDGWFAEPWP